MQCHRRHEACGTLLLLNALFFVPVIRPLTQSTPHAHTTHLRLSGYPKGDILVFMTGQEDIDAVCFLLQERLEELIADGAKVAELEILPIHRWAVEVTADGEEGGGEKER